MARGVAPWSSCHLSGPSDNNYCFSLGASRHVKRLRVAPGWVEKDGRARSRCLPVKRPEKWVVLVDFSFEWSSWGHLGGTSP